MVTQGIRRYTSFVALGSSLLLAACAGGPQIPGFGGGASGTAGATPAGAPAAQDDTPARPTALVETVVSSTGIAGFFPFEGTTVKQTRADMQRDESTTKGTGTMSRFLVPTISQASITRLDRKLVWQLDPPKSTYTECPLTGCATPERPTQQRQEREPSAAKEPGCTMRIARNTFDVRQTGMRRQINGFNTEEYQAQWLLVLEDGTKRQSTSKLEIDMWTTAPTGGLRDAQAIEATFARASAKATPAAGLPPDMQKAMQQFLAQSLSANERGNLFNLAREFEKIKGYPILTTMRWGFGGNACGGTNSPAEGAGGGGGVMGLLGALGGGGNKPAGDAPLFSFTTEVKRYQVDQVRDSQFNVPANYRRTN